MTLPGNSNPFVYGSGFFGVLDAQRILVVVADHRRAEMNHRRITTQFGFSGRSKLGEELLRRTRPVCKSIESTPVADDAANLGFLDEQSFQFMLYVKDRSLGCSSGWFAISTRKPPCKQQTGGLGQYRYPVV